MLGCGPLACALADGPASRPPGRLRPRHQRLGCGCFRSSPLYAGGPRTRLAGRGASAAPRVRTVAGGPAAGALACGPDRLHGCPPPLRQRPRSGAPGTLAARSDSVGPRAQPCLLPAHGAPRPARFCGPPGPLPASSVGHTWAAPLQPVPGLGGCSRPVLAAVPHALCTAAHPLVVGLCPRPVRLVSGSAHPARFLPFAAATPAFCFTRRASRGAGLASAAAVAAVLCSPALGSPGGPCLDAPAQQPPPGAALVRCSARHVRAAGTVLRVRLIAGSSSRRPLLAPPPRGPVPLFAPAPPRMFAAPASYESAHRSPVSGRFSRSSARSVRVWSVRGPRKLRSPVVLCPGRPRLAPPIFPLLGGAACVPRVRLPARSSPPLLRRHRSEVSVAAVAVPRRCAAGWPRARAAGPACLGLWTAALSPVHPL